MDIDNFQYLHGSILNIYVLYVVILIKILKKYLKLKILDLKLLYFDVNL